MPSSQDFAIGIPEPSIATRQSTRAPPSKWASGRVLTKAQRARKREVDRNAQRNARIKERKRVEELEAKVRELQQTASLNSILPTDVPPCQNITITNTNMTPLAYNDTLSRSPMSGNTCIGSQTSAASPGSVSERGLESLSPNSWNPMDLALWPDLTMQLSFLRSDIAIRPGVRDQSPVNQPRSQPNIVQPAPILLFPPPPQEPPFDRNLPPQNRQLIPSGSDVTMFLYDILKRLQLKFLKQKQPSKVSIITSQDITHDFFARVVLYGWEIALQRRFVCPLWLLLRDVDEQIFMNSSIIVRLSILHLIHSKFLNLLQGTKIANWQNPRPSQDLYPHNPVIDYIAWPGLRERLVLSDFALQTILTNRFWYLLARNLRFNFPYSEQQALVFDRSTGKYSFSSEYLDRFDDISNWGVTSEFFDAFPKLRDDLSLAKELKSVEYKPESEEVSSWETKPCPTAKTFMVNSEEGQMVLREFTENFHNYSETIIDNSNWTYFPLHQ